MEFLLWCMVSFVIRTKMDGHAERWNLLSMQQADIPYSEVSVENTSPHVEHITSKFECCIKNVWWECTPYISQKFRFDDKEKQDSRGQKKIERNHQQTFLKMIGPWEPNHHSWLAKSLHHVLCVSYLHEVVDSLEVCQVVIGHVHTNAEVQTSITPVNDLEVSELWEQHRQSLSTIWSLVCYDNSSSFTWA